MNDDRRATILVVDDAPENIDVLSGILRDEYRVKVALNGAKALEVATARPSPDLILLDLMMPGMDGYEVCRRLKADPATRRIPVLMVTAMNEVEDEARGFEVGAVDYLTKPVSAPIVRARVRTQLALYDSARHLETLVDERTRELRETRLRIIQCLGRAAEFKDDITGLHVLRMSHYARLLGSAAGMGEDEADLLFHAAPMHDVGKIGVPDRILQKAGKLDPEEWALMQQHVHFGVDIIGPGDSAIMQMARTIALCHHEKWDGSGYPRGLAGEDIPLAGRVVAVADVFDALSSERPYKKAWPIEDCIAELKAQAGRHFDPRLVALFLDLMPQMVEIRGQYQQR